VKKSLKNPAGKKKNGSISTERASARIDSLPFREKVGAESGREKPYSLPGETGR